MKKIDIKTLGKEFMIFGNKGNVWSDTSHAFKSGFGNLCGTPSLSTNHARISGVEVVGCPECLEKLNQTK
jgi:hypothetical protein